jgi:A118 family predicted phage portal protein
MNWAKTTAEKLKTEVSNMESYIDLWNEIYKGNQNWLEYWYASLNGTKTKRERRTFNGAKMASSELASLIYSEKPNIITDDSILDFLKENNFLDKIQKYTEFGSALGGFALKLYAKDSKLKIDYVNAESFIPISWDNSRVIEADFIDKKVVDNKTYIRVEEHRKKDNKYTITNKMYRQENADMIKESPEKFGFSSEPVIIDSTIPMFVYIPTPGANNLEKSSPLGISIYANAIDTLKSLDIAFDAIAQEIILGKKRIIVPTSAVRSVLNPETGRQEKYFDANDEAFIALDTGDSEYLKIVDNTVEMRIDEVTKAIQTLLNIFSTQIGFSSGYFSFDEKTGLKTATEVISENSKTFKTKKSFENNLRTGILELLEAVRIVGPQYGIITSQDEYNIVFNDNIIEDRDSKTNYWQNRFLQGTATLEDVLINVDGLSEEEAKKKAEEIKKANATIDTENVLFGGNDFTNTDPETTDEAVEVAKLSGIQIKSANEIISQVAEGILTRDAGINQLKVFLGLTEEQANQVMGRQ